MQALQFAGPFGFLLSIPVLYGISPAAPLLTPLAILLGLLTTEQLRGGTEGRDKPSALRLLPLLYIPLQLGVIVWAMSAMDSSPLPFVALAISVGACTGVFGMLAAHEMVHSRLHWERRLGLLMLFGMSYPHFRLAHVHGHHRYAATVADASTARFGESFWSFLLRTVPTQIRVAWNFERRRTRLKALVALQNRVTQGAFVLMSLYAALLLLQPRAAAFFAGQSAVGILVLELFNYVAHYGLLRSTRREGLEPFADHHSWNSQGVGNLLIFNMGRHSDHHRNPTISYEQLQPVTPAPQLPFGYSGAILMALVPPLWRAVMDHRIKPVAAKPTESGYSGESPAAAMP